MAEPKLNKIYTGHVLDILKTWPNEFVDCVVTSPPYWGLRMYDTPNQNWGGLIDCDHVWMDKHTCWHSDRGASEHKEVADMSFQQKGTASKICTKCGCWNGSLGLEPTPELFIRHLCSVFDEIKRVLKPTGTLWVNIDDSYMGSGQNSGKRIGSTVGGKYGIDTRSVGIAPGVNEIPPTMITHPTIKNKSLCLIPQRFVIGMQDSGWIVRNAIIWKKDSCMPESCRDRFTNDFEYMYLFTKQKDYYFEQQFEPCAGNGTVGQGRNKRAVWTINPKPFLEAHFATFPEELIGVPIVAGCPESICKTCGEPILKELVTIGQHITEEMKVAGCNNNGGYEGQSKKDYKEHNAQDASSAKRSILQSMSNIKKSVISKCQCNTGFAPGIVLDPFMGAGTSAVVALKNNRDFLGIELNPSYVAIAEKRIKPYKEQTRLLC